MGKRGYMHKSPLDIKFVKGAARQRYFVDSYNEKVRKLRAEKCKCGV